MDHNSEFHKYKQETLKIANAKRVFLIIGLSLLGLFLGLLIIGLVALVSAQEGRIAYSTSIIFISLAVGALIASIVMLILRKVLYDKKLKDRQAMINKTIQKRKEKKVYHN